MICLTATTLEAYSFDAVDRIGEKMILQAVADSGNLI